MKTLGIFAKQPVPGRVKTRLAADWGHDKAAALYECFVLDLIHRLGTAGDRRVIGYSPDSQEARLWFQTTSSAGPSTDTWALWAQPETDLGGRMAGFFDQWTESPEHRTVLIGSDSPTLPQAYLDQAWHLLEHCDCVLGPATDGGYYLVGLRGTVPDFAAPFRDIEWSTAQVLTQTVSALKDHDLSLGLLPPWYDVDSAAAVSTLAGHLRASVYANEPCVLTATATFLDIG